VDYRDSPYDDRPSGRNPWYVIGPILFLIGMGLLAFLISGFFRNNQPDPNRLNDPEAKPRTVAPRGQRDPEEIARIKLFKDVKDSVVNVDTILIQRNSFNLTEAERRQGTGSGFVWDDQGHIVTNFHVIMSALQRNQNLAVRVTTSDRTSYDAVLIGASPDHDLAVLKINADSSKLKPITVGTSSDLEVGQTVFALGNPFGQSLTLTQGIISALEREIESVTDKPISGVIQTDAAINPGNSGGPLFDKDGRLIGVNTAITSPSGGSVGIGYSIPVDTVNDVVPELIRTGRKLRPVLGIVALPDKYKRSLGISKGIIIQEVRTGGPAANAGLRGLIVNNRGEKEIGDILISIKGESINSFADLDRVMAKCKVQEKVPVVVQRGRELLEIEVTLAGI
jgi:S1-C subfamily serine protease